MYRILFVDDEPIVKVALRTIVDWESLGFTVCSTASDGTEALAQVEKYSPDLIITDLKMPEMDGLALIRELKTRKYPGKIIVASNFGEYELVREALTLGAMDYILKISIQPAELAALVKKAANELESERQAREAQDTERRQMELGMKRARNALLREYFLNPAHGEDFLAENEAAFPPLSQSLLCLLAVSPQCAGQRSIPPHMVESLLREILNTVEETEILSLGAESLLIIFPKEELEQKGICLTELMRQTEDALKVYTGIGFSVVYSPVIQGYARAKEQFNRCRDAAECLFYGYKDIIFSEAVRFQYRVADTTPQEFSAQIVEHLEIADMDGAMEPIKTLMEECKAHLVQPQSLKAYLWKVLHYLSTSGLSLHIAEPEAFVALLDQLSSCMDCGQADEVFRTALALFANSDLPDGGTGMKKEVLLAIRYINRNYSKRITLFEIGRQVNLNENYLSRIFKEQTGKSIVNYLNEVRMKHAAKLLECGGYIKEVSTSVGIDDSFYFTRLFKKYYGVNPTEYKAVQPKSRLSDHVDSPRL